MNMAELTKKQQGIVAAAAAYMADKGLTQAELGHKSGVGPTYLNVMLGGGTHLNNTLIAAKYWNMLEALVNPAPALWPMLDTTQGLRIRAELVQAKQKQLTRMIVAEPGAGKTMSVNWFKDNAPKHTYVITMNDLMTVNDVLDTLERDLGVTGRTRRAMKLYDIILKLRDIRNSGGYPIIIIEEAENMNMRTRKLLKAVFDGVDRYCALVLVGTPDLLTNVEKAKKSGKDAGPQFYRRFVPGLVRVAGINRNFDLFYKTHNVPDGLRKLLNTICENYGELNRWLEPVLEECATKGVDLTEELFREVHNMPAYR